VVGWLVGWLVLSVTSDKMDVYACSGDSGAVMLLNITQVLLVRGTFGVVMMLLMRAREASTIQACGGVAPSSWSPGSLRGTAPLVLGAGVGWNPRCLGYANLRRP
jgi:hypothetical protein